MANGASKIFEIMKNTADKNKNISELATLYVKSLSPLVFRLDEKTDITEDFYDLDMNFNSNEIQVGDTVKAIVLNEGQLYYILGNIEIDEKISDLKTYLENKIDIINNELENKLDKEDGINISPSQPTTGEKVWIKKGKNLFNKNNVSKGAELTGVSGEEISNENWFVSNYIEVKPNTTYYLSGNKTVGNANCFYDENHNFLSYVPRITGAIISPNNAYYMKFNGLLTELNNNIQFEENIEATTYEAYIEKAILIKEKNSYNNFNHIVESGNNLNGYWIKYADGTMICRYNMRFTAANSNFNTSYGSIYYNGIPTEWTYPIPFVGNRPTVIANAFLKGGIGGFSCTAEPGLDKIEGYCYSAKAYDFGAGGDYRSGVNFMAIGRWK